MKSGGGWEATHLEGRKYVLAHGLDYDASHVLIKAQSRTTGKPGAQGAVEIVWERKFSLFSRGELVEADLAPTWPDAPLPFRFLIDWHDEYGEKFHSVADIPSPSRLRTRPELRSPVPVGFGARAGQLATLANKPAAPVAPHQYAEPVPDVDPREVFVVVGRNTAANNSMFAFLRAINLKPIEWSMAIAATGSGSPYIGDALDAAFARAQAVVVFMTPDDIAQLRPEYASGTDDPELRPTPQARPNVLFEAGMALGLHPNRTILVELGSLRSFSDVAGRHAVRLDNSAPKRSELANRLKNAGCDVETSGSDWYEAGDFSAPKAPSGPATGRRLPSNTSSRKNHLDARFLSRSSGSDRIQLINVGSKDVFELTSPNEGDFRGRIDGFPIPRLPAGKSVTLICMQVMGGPDTWDLVVEGHTGDGETFTESLFLDLNG